MLQTVINQCGAMIRSQSAFKNFNGRFSARNLKTVALYEEVIASQAEADELLPDPTKDVAISEIDLHRYMEAANETGYLIDFTNIEFNHTCNKLSLTGKKNDEARVRCLQEHIKLKNECFSKTISRKKIAKKLLESRSHQLKSSPYSTSE